LDQQLLQFFEEDNRLRLLIAGQVQPAATGQAKSTPVASVPIIPGDKVKLGISET
jgi:hypothetical protein